jgi:hypothetical protein
LAYGHSEESSLQNLLVGRSVMGASNAKCIYRVGSIITWNLLSMEFIGEGIG